MCNYMHFSLIQSQNSPFDLFLYNTLRCPVLFEIRICLLCGQLNMPLNYYLLVASFQRLYGWHINLETGRHLFQLVWPSNCSVNMTAVLQGLYFEVNFRISIISSKVFFISFIAGIYTFCGILSSALSTRTFFSNGSIVATSHMYC